MTAQEFFNKYNGVGLDFDGYYGDQCVDEVQYYNRDVVGAPALTGNAIDIFTTYPKDFYDQVTNTPDGVPQVGDIVIWGTSIGQYGHIAIFVKGDPNQFTSFDQNWPLNSLCHFQPHNYSGVVGWLHPKNVATEQQTSSQTQSIPTPDNPPIAPDVPLVLSDAQTIQLGDPLGVWAVGAIRSEILDRRRDVAAQKTTIEDQQVEITKLQEQIEALQTINKVQVETVKDIANPSPNTGSSTTYQVAPAQPVSGLNIASLLSDIFHKLIG